MKTVVVNIRVIEGRAEEFVEETLENMGHSLQEAGISRFELLRDESDSNRFLLVEGYRDTVAQAAHKETAHYKKWRERVEPMMAEPRTRAEYAEIRPAHRRR
jgi:(4S)-4-hydroxy-5-phosphonooxypentane-2,3-dione isomerase